MVAASLRHSSHIVYTKIIQCRKLVSVTLHVHIAALGLRRSLDWLIVGAEYSSATSCLTATTVRVGLQSCSL